MTSSKSNIQVKSARGSIFGHKIYSTPREFPSISLDLIFIFILRKIRALFWTPSSSPSTSTSCALISRTRSRMCIEHWCWWWLIYLAAIHVARKALILLSLKYAFCWYHIQTDTEFIEKIIKRSFFIVFLPSFSPKVEQVLREHNWSTLHIFTIYVKTFLDQHIDTAYSNLPLIGLQIDAQRSKIKVSKSILLIKFRVAFVGFFGYGDQFENISELYHTTRRCIFLEEAVMLHFNIYPEEWKTTLNVYISDFFVHRDLTALGMSNDVEE